MSTQEISGRFRSCIAGTDCTVHPSNRYPPLCGGMRGDENMIDTYKKLIIQMVNEQEDELLLQQIYTILIRRKRKAEENEK